MEKILLVEDDSSIILGIKYSLEQEGFYVDIAKTLNIARDFIKDNNYSLLLLDINLPDGNGYDFCNEIRGNSDVGIIFLTACDEEVNIVMGLDIGGDDYITKPFRVRELISRINAVIRRKKKLINYEEKKILKFDDLKIDTLAMKVLKKGEEIILTSSEYKLLLLFINNFDITLTREVILDKLWDDSGEFVNDNTLSVYIKRLRRKIEDDPSNPKYIITIRGLGYKWQCRRSED
ncbi:MULTISPECIES: response regulator transcription factor [Clostridium]|uniref:Stage 0 sporulation protein A homolog n=1 Tax=Clostridium senegalense TaxID=1465809 RepID=A0A6M0H0S2_9CLOT|nr:MULTISPECIES: response regulator transcription factor [Clostridium]NEU04189.1 response regulator transcription factor [Clostridium senegalense]